MPHVAQVSLPASLHDHTEDSQIMDDVLEILVENGELPPSAVSDPVASAAIDGSFVSAADSFSPADVLSDDVLCDTHVTDSLAADELQRELDDIQNEILSHADLHAVNGRVGHCDMDPAAPDLDAELSVDLLSNGDFHAEFGGSDPTTDDHEFYFRSLLQGDGDRLDDRSQHTGMDIGEDPPERMAMTPLTNGDLLDHSRTGFEYMDDLSLPSLHNEDTRQEAFDERQCEIDLKEFGIDPPTSMNVDSDGYEYCGHDMDTEMIPNVFGRGYVPQCDPLLGGVLARPPPRPARKHYSWDKIEFDAT